MFVILTSVDVTFSR